MPRPPSNENIVPMMFEYDFEKMENIINALDFMRGQAAETGCAEIKNVVDCCFSMVLSTYCLLLRHNLIVEFDCAELKQH